MSTLNKYIIVKKADVERSLSCECGNCNVYKELFHAAPLATHSAFSESADGWNSIKKTRDAHHPEDMVYFFNYGVEFGTTYYRREDKTFYVYNREKHLWENKDKI